MKTLWLFLAVAGCCLAQSITGSVVGTLSDPSGAAVPGITVQLINESTGAQRAATTNESGDYLFTLVPPGTYTVAANSSQFRPVRVTHVQVEVDRAVRVNVVFEISAISEAVTVSAENVVKVETDTATLAQTVEPKRITELPIARNFVALAAITAGVVPVTGENGSRCRRTSPTEAVCRCSWPGSANRQCRSSSTVSRAGGNGWATRPCPCRSTRFSSSGFSGTACRRSTGTPRRSSTCP